MSQLCEGYDLSSLEKIDVELMRLGGAKCGTIPWLDERICSNGTSGAISIIMKFVHQVYRSF